MTIEDHILLHMRPVHVNPLSLQHVPCLCMVMYIHIFDQHIFTAAKQRPEIFLGLPVLFNIRILNHTVHPFDQIH